MMDMEKRQIPDIFLRLQSQGCLEGSDLMTTGDGFWLAYKSIADLLAVKGILDVPGAGGRRIRCDRFFDDWFLYAVPHGSEYTYSLLKLREQEHDAKEEIPADGDTPGVTISFIAFACEILLDCLADPTDEHRRSLDREINRVVVHRGQCHHDALKQYFLDPVHRGSYLVSSLYIRHIAAYAKDGCLEVPEHYKKIVQQSKRHKSSKKLGRIPAFIEGLNREAGHVICDHEWIYIQNREDPTEYEAAAILATHTGNTSSYSFAAEVEYHAKFLTPLAKIKIPLWGRSVYDSAIRADMTIEDKEFEGPAPFYRERSGIVKRQCALHQKKEK